MWTSPVPPAKQVWKIRPVLPASTLTGLVQPGSSALLCPHVQIHHTSRKRPCSNSSIHSSNFKGLCQEAWWIPEAQGTLLKACPLKCYKSPRGTDILPDSLIKAETPSQFSLLHLKNGTTVLLIPGMEIFNEIVHFNKFPQEKNAEKRMLLVYAFEIYVSHWNKY